MKRCFWVCCVLISVNCVAQNRGNIWMLGYQPFVKDCGIDFSQGFADTFSVGKDLEFFLTDASICDTNSELMMYTNGININNRNHQIMINSQGFNPGSETTEDTLSGLSASQGALILPVPGELYKYCIFHISGEEIEGGSQTQPLVLRYTIVDMIQDNGLGGVMQDKKGMPLINDTLVWGRITACKHANGEDWWIISHRWNSDLYYRLLLTKDTILGPYTQNIGSLINKNDIFGQACFSPDGTKFCYVNCDFNFDYMQFDRCSGEFSYAVNITLDSNITQGCAFSPNSRFLYINNYNEIYQFDTWAGDIVSSKLLIDSIPFIQTGIPDWFAVQMLAPDNKIYISTYHGVKTFHCINHPDSLGSESSFIRGNLPLPTYNGYSIPNHPNYDLGESSGSDTCEVIYTSAPKPSKNETTYRIAPNPVSGFLNIIYQSNDDALLELFDLYGKRVGAISLFHYFKNRLLNVSELPSGVYLAAVSCQGERVWSEKVVVQR